MSEYRRNEAAPSDSVETAESVLGSVGDFSSLLGVVDPTGPFTDNGAESEREAFVSLA